MIGVSAIGMMLFTSRPVGDAMATTIWGTASSWTLTALPLFVWMGEILFRTKLSENLFKGLSPWMQKLPGGLIHVNVVGCALFAAISGSSAVESAIKMNDQYWGNEENFIVTFTPGFHGTSYLTRNMGDTSDGIKRIKKVPTPLWRNQKNQAKEEEKALKYLRLLIKSYNCCGRKIGCIVMETLPWLKGGIPWSPYWWRSIRDLCNNNNILIGRKYDFLYF